MITSPENKEYDFKNVHVLVAEDDPINLIVAAKILESKNATVLKASNGYEAVKLLNDGGHADIVLLDLEMPVMDGYSAIKKIKEKFPNIPVLAFTASVLDKKMLAQLIEQGFTDTIPKPFKPEIFYGKILDALK